CVYRRDLPEMPCGKQMYEQALEEGCQFLFLAAPVAVLSNGKGEAAGLRLIQTELGPADSDGRRSFKTLPGTEFDLQADWVISALGFNPLSCPATDDFNELSRNDWGGIMVDKDQMTSIPGVFAGGDIVQGPATVLHAVRDARQAVAGIDSYLSARRPVVKA
ncbi:MAG TPA: FAD-dependent oxidoreductase, partial [Clostridia bacterium]|nr:FAD-dependent oxidoreductase [Clostridia bacterium]